MRNKISTCQWCFEEPSIKGSAYCQDCLDMFQKHAKLLDDNKLQVADNKLPDKAMVAENVYGARIRVPKKVAEIKLCGALSINVDDTMNFVMPTEAQRKNLKEMLCIEVIPAEETNEA